MRNSLKVAKWEMKRNLKSKSFIISLFLTPIIFIIAFSLPILFSAMDSGEPEQPDPVTVQINDEIGIWSELEPMILDTYQFNWDISETDDPPNEIRDELQDASRSAYIHLTEATIENGELTVLVSDGVPSSFQNELQVFEEPIRNIRLMNLGLSEEELTAVQQPVAIQTENVAIEDGEEETLVFGFLDETVLERAIPGVVAGVILFSIIISGMMIFQSASQEKKDKVAEIILSSLTPGELMQGKVLGYFGLGLFQLFVWALFIVPFVLWRVDFPILQYLLVPELAVLVLIAILGYLLFASMFVGLGATIEDASTSGNFQSLVLMLPFLPFFLITPVITNPDGMIATVASFVPFSAPGVLILRLSIIEDWPWIEVFTAIAVLIVFIFLFMKLAGKIFKVGILMYGKNATPGEIWKWIRS